MSLTNLLWFDVILKDITTQDSAEYAQLQLWFDVILKDITTAAVLSASFHSLWFDVILKDITTPTKGRWEHR